MAVDFGPSPFLLGEKFLNLPPKINDAMGCQLWAMSSKRLMTHGSSLTARPKAKRKTCSVK